jgi:hypothetical protein
MKQETWNKKLETRNEKRETRNKNKKQIMNKPHPQTETVVQKKEKNRNTRFIPAVLPENPMKGLMPYRRPSLPTLSHETSALTQRDVQPGSVEISNGPPKEIRGEHDTKPVAHEGKDEEKVTTQRK